MKGQLRQWVSAPVWLLYSAVVWAVETTETRPDGTIVKTTKYYPPVSEMIIIGIVVVFGGIVALFGAWLILKALQLGRSDGMADIEVDASARTLKMRKLGQGTVVAAFGAMIMLGALFFLTR